MTVFSPAASPLAPSCAEYVCLVGFQVDCLWWETFLRWLKDTALGFFAHLQNFTLVDCRGLLGTNPLSFMFSI